MHNINTYVGRQAAWHELGTVTGKYQSWQDMIEHGGFDFQPIKKQLEFQGRPVDAWGIFRSDNNTFLGVVGKDYTPIDHAQGFRLVDSLVDSVDGAHYETAGVLGLGETVWGLADLNLSINVGRNGDRSDMYLLFATSHNRTMSFAYWLTKTRVVCQNTLRFATAAASKLTIRHTRSAQQRIDQAHAALATIRDESRGIEDKLNFLATRRMTREAMTSILDRLFPPRTDENGNARDTTRRNNILGEILSRYEYCDGGAFPEHRGTAYNLLNAVTEYTDHYRSSRGDGRAESAMFGTGERLKSQALEVITLGARDLPSVPATTTYVFERREVAADSPLLDQILETQYA